MKRVDSILLKVFLCGIPVIAVLAGLSYLYGAGAVSHHAGFGRLMNNFMGLVFALWMVLSMYLCVRLVVSGPFRDQVIAKITFIRERDEREAILTGKAAKTAMLTSLALLILLFCLSCFHVSIYKVPPENAVNGKTGFITLGLGFDLLKNGEQDRPKERIQKQDIFSYRGLPVSGTTVILVLIVWQIVAYNYSMRRLMR
ncbi:MAG: hypothetical protein A4E64_00819 [Syntrophorhabdus sp. PtaU1.Bin058]|nr:MAG: hypothetical protein A4E64_00819 [Syntrophorhabdus sp. PtaU1.Bin058]